MKKKIKFPQEKKNILYMNKKKKKKKMNTPTMKEFDTCVMGPDHWAKDDKTFKECMQDRGFKGTRQEFLSKLNMNVGFYSMADAGKPVSMFDSKSCAANLNGSYAYNSGSSSYAYNSGSDAKSPLMIPAPSDVCATGSYIPGPHRKIPMMAPRLNAVLPPNAGMSQYAPATGYTESHYYGQFPSEAVSGCSSFYPASAMMTTGYDVAPYASYASMY